LSFTVEGALRPIAPAASSPNESLLSPLTTKPFSTRQAEGSCFHLSAASAKSISRAVAPTCR